MKKYLDDLKNELAKRNFKPEDIDDILKDHEEMISEALNEGLSEEDIPSRFGDPKTLAEELSLDGNNKEFDYSLNDTKGFKLYKSFSPTEGGQKIIIGMVYQDVLVKLSQDGLYHIYYEGPGDINDYSISYQKDELKIEAPKLKGLLFTRNKKDDMSFIIEIPSGIEISEFREKTVSGDIDFQGIDAKEMFFSTTSGDIELKKAIVDKLVVNTVSGDVAVYDLKMNKVETSQVSGDLHMENVIITELIHAGSVSGDFMFVNAHVEHAEFSMVNGDVEGKEFYPKMITFKSVSGDLDIKNKERTDIKLQKTNTLSGKINIA